VNCRTSSVAKLEAMDEEPASKRTRLSGDTTELPSRRERDDASVDDRENSSNKRHCGGPSSIISRSSDTKDGESNGVTESRGKLTLSFISAKVSELKHLQETEGKEIAAFLGRTGVGKTTTIDFCCGAHIVKVKLDDDEYSDFVLDVDATESKNYLKIGHLGSMTKDIELLSSPNKKQGVQLLLCGDNFFLTLMVFPSPISSSVWI
jgi:hypothetical protein